MSFISLEFLFIFLPLFIALYLLINNIFFKNCLLLLFSLLFYAWGEPKRILILIVLIILCYFFSYIISNKKNKYLLFLFIIILISPLLLYKYYLGSMPLGISFYTFQLLSYLIDVYMGRCCFEKNLLNLSIYFSMFPVISSGPILRYIDVKDSINKREVSINNVENGLARFIIGLSKKIILANNLANISDVAFGINVHIVQANMAWLGAIAYMLQIYYDFSGYSDMAIGIGQMLGFNFKENFDEPYLSKSITEFWRRWHISLGSWFRDYIYIPLGGNRVSVVRWIINILAVWILTGIWHGSSLNYIAWGLYNGIILIVEKKYLKTYLATKNNMSHIYTLILLFGGWIIFRIQNIIDIPYYIFALIDIRNLGTISELASQGVLFDILYVLIGIICIIPKFKHMVVKFVHNKYLYNIALILLLVISVIFIENGSYKAFLYFGY